MFSLWGAFRKGAEITLITPDLDNASEGKREYEAPGNTGAFVFSVVNATYYSFVLSIAKMKMRSSIAGFIVLVLTCFSFACKKDIAGNETDLYGTWVKGSNFGDTIWFMKKNGQNIIRVPQSFNPLLPTYSEKEYRLNGE